MPSIKRLNEARFLRIIVSETYERDGEKRRQSTEVGRAFVKTTEGGEEYISLKIFAGLSIHGNVAIFQANEKEDGNEAQKNKPPGKSSQLPRGKT